MKIRRAHTRRRLVIFIGIMVVASAAYVLGWSSVFTVKHVVVVGAPNPSEAYVIEHSVHVGDKMARHEVAAKILMVRSFKDK